MKKAFIKSLGLVLALSACQKENNEIGYSDIEEPVSVSFSSQISRVAGTQWELNDEVGISAADGNSVNYTNVKYLSDVSGNFTVADGVEPICFGSQNAMSFTAYYPYSSTVADNLITGNTLSDNKKCNFLWAQASDIHYSSSPAVNFTFNHSMAELRIELTYPQGINVDAYKNVTISGLKHDGNFNINTGVASPNADASAEDWNIALSQEETTALSFKGVIFPQAVSGMVLKMNNVDYNINFKDTEKLDAGKYYTISAVINADGSVKVSINVIGSTINDYKDGGEAKIAFLSSAATADVCDDEARAAYNWLVEAYPGKVTYVAVTENRDLSEFDLVWSHMYYEQVDVTINDKMKSYYTNGGRIFASLEGAMSVDSWGITLDGSQPNNPWAPNIGSVDVGVGIADYYHPIFNDLLNGNDYLNLHGKDGSSDLTSRCLQWRTKESNGNTYDNDRYNNLTIWELKTGGRSLGSDSNAAERALTVRIAEFGSQVTPGVKGSAIVIGEPSYIWRDINENKFSDNIKNLTKNTIEYLLNL